MVKRGFTTAMSSIIFFIGAILATSLAVAAIGFMLKEVQGALQARTNTQVLQTQTILSVADTGYDTNHIWVYLRNIGKTDLNVDRMDVFVNGSWWGSCNSAKVTCTDETNNGILSPNEVLDVNILYPNVPAGSYRVRVDTEYGSYVDATVVVG